MNPNAPSFFVPVVPSVALEEPKKKKRPVKGTNLSVEGEEVFKLSFRHGKKDLAVSVSASTRLWDAFELYKARRVVPGVGLRELTFSVSATKTTTAEELRERGDLACDGTDVVDVSSTADHFLSDEEVFNTAEGALAFYRTTLKKVSSALTALENDDDDEIREVVDDDDDDPLVKRLMDLFMASSSSSSSSKKTTTTTKKKPPPPKKKKIVKVDDDSDTLFALLKTIRCEQYAATFAAEDIRTVTDLKLVLRDSDLRDMGLPVGPRRRIQAALAAEPTHAREPPEHHRQRVVTPPTTKSVAFPDNYDQHANQKDDDDDQNADNKPSGKHKYHRRHRNFAKQHHNNAKPTKE